MNELIERCNATQFGGLSDAELGKDAVALVEQNPMTLLTTLTYLLLTVSASQMRLSDDQKLAVLHEAQIAYENGIELQTADPVASKDSFRRAANRYQVLVDDGVENGMLWYNLGNSQLLSENIGEAIAAYRIGQRYIPSDGRLTANLQFARSLVANSVKKEKHYFNSQTISVLARRSSNKSSAYDWIIALVLVVGLYFQSDYSELSQLSKPHPSY